MAVLVKLGSQTGMIHLIVGQLQQKKLVHGVPTSHFRPLSLANNVMLVIPAQLIFNRLLIIVEFLMLPAHHAHQVTTVKLDIIIVRKFLGVIKLPQLRRQQ